MKMFVLAVIASTLPVAAIAQDAQGGAIDAAFAAMDGNKDGKVDRAEYSRFMQARFNRQAQEMEAAFVVMDADKNGQISKAEAAAVPAIASAFEVLDANKDGGLSAAEMQSALASAQALEASR